MGSSGAGVSSVCGYVTGQVTHDRLLGRHLRFVDIRVCSVSSLPSTASAPSDPPLLAPVTLSSRIATPPVGGPRTGTDRVTIPTPPASTPTHAQQQQQQQQQEQEQEQKQHQEQQQDQQQQQQEQQEQQTAANTTTAQLATPRAARNIIATVTSPTPASVTSTTNRVAGADAVDTDDDTADGADSDGDGSADSKNIVSYVSIGKIAALVFHADTPNPSLQTQSSPHEPASWNGFPSGRRTIRKGQMVQAWVTGKERREGINGFHDQWLLQVGAWRIAKDCAVGGAGDGGRAKRRKGGSGIDVVHPRASEGGDDDRMLDQTHHSLALCQAWARGRCSLAGACDFRHWLLVGEKQRRERLRQQREDSRRLAGEHRHTYTHANTFTEASVNADTTGKIPHHSTDTSLKAGTNGTDGHSRGGGTGTMQRATVFAKWLLLTFGTEALCRGSGILDIAGGKGFTSLQLLLQCPCPYNRRLRCTVVDPLRRKTLLSKRHRKALRRALNGESGGGKPHQALPLDGGDGDGDGDGGRGRGRGGRGGRGGDGGGRGGRGGRDGARSGGEDGPTDTGEAGDAIRFLHVKFDDAFHAVGTHIRRRVRESLDTLNESKDSPPSSIIEETQSQIQSQIQTQTPRQHLVADPPRELDTAKRNNTTETGESLLSHASCVIGMHPDQATGDLVMHAIASKAPFAVVPCCVFPMLFPHRRTPSGEAVVFIEQLGEWIQSQHVNVRSSLLTMPGRNRVFFMRRSDYL